MLNKVSDKTLLKIRNSILINAIPILEEQGFEKSPFISSWFGRNNLGDFYLNIFDLFPIPKTLSELNKINGIAFRLAPNNRTQMRLDIELPKRNFIDFIFPKKEYRLKNFFTYSGLVKRQCELENVLKHDFKNIDLKIEMWYKAHKPMKTNWDGEAVYS